MLENKEQEKIAGIISDFFDGAVNEADIDILAMKIYEKYVAKLEQDLEFTTKTANELIEIKHKLEQELAELKEKAIVPRFRIGQEIWYVGCSSIQSWIVNRIELDYMVNDKLCELYRLGHYGTDDYSCCIMPFDSDRYFATEKEAQEKLKEIQGDE